jgi:peptidyl-prolyl cis-trans isomerase SurA
MKYLLVAAILACASGQARGAERVLADEVVAIVDEAVILRSDVLGQMALEAMRQGLTREQMMQGSQAETLFRQILDNMVQDELLLARARLDSLEAPADDVDERVRARMRELKDQHGAEAFVRQLAEEGLSEREVRDRLRKTIRKEILRQMITGRMMRDVSVSTKDVDAFRQAYRGALPPLYSLSHLMVAPVASEDRKAEARKKIEGLLDRVRAGEDFAELARTNSEDPGSAPYGGDLGFFGRGMMVPEVEEASYRLPPGQVSDVIESDFGFHILRVEERQDDRVHARHILISVRPSEQDIAAAYQEAVGLYDRIKSGEKFEDLARAHSDHAESAARGGLLGPYSKEQPPPGFAGALSGMGLGDVSTPIRTEFGWHLVRVDDSDQAIEDIVRQTKIQEHFAKVLDGMRADLYVDIRI